MCEGARRQFWLSRVADFTLTVCPIPSLDNSVLSKALSPSLSPSPPPLSDPWAPAPQAVRDFR
jgi:hypothetical protein